jgi:hypothetical protein
MNHLNPGQQALALPQVDSERDMEEQLRDCISDGFYALRNSTCFLLADLGQIATEEVHPEYTPATVRLFLDLTSGSESWRGKYWLNPPVDDADQARRTIESQKREVQNFIANLNRIDGLSFFFAWHIEGDDTSDSYEQGLDYKDAMMMIVDRLAADLAGLVQECVT